jgi:hypothetical protein
MKLYEYICLAKYFHKSIDMLVFNIYFYKNKKSKLHFGDRVAVLNDLIYAYGGSIYIPNAIHFTSLHIGSQTPVPPSIRSDQLK